MRWFAKTQSVSTEPPGGPSAEAEAEAELRLAAEALGIPVSTAVAGAGQSDAAPVADVDAEPAGRPGAIPARQRVRKTPPGKLSTVSRPAARRAAGGGRR